MQPNSTMTSRMTTKCQPSATPAARPTPADASIDAPMIASPPMLGVPVLERCDCGPSSLTNCLNCFFSRYGSSSFVKAAPRIQPMTSAMIGYRNISIFVSPCFYPVSCRLQRCKACLCLPVHRSASLSAASCAASMRSAISSSAMPREALTSTTSPAASSPGKCARNSFLSGKY